MNTPNSKQKKDVELTMEDISYLEGMLEAYKAHMEIDESNDEAVRKQEIRKVERLEDKLTRGAE